MAARAIGLDIGSSALRAAELSFTGGGVTLRKVGQVELPEDAVVNGVVVDAAVVTAALKRLWRAERFSTRTVHLGVANQRVVVRQVELPDMPDADLAQALPFQVADLLSIPVEDAVLDFHRVERTTSASGPAVQRGLLVAAPRETVLANVRAVEAARLRVASVDLTSFALMRSVGNRWGQDAGTEAILDVGARVTNLTVHTAGVPHLVRVLLAGGHDLTEAVARERGTSLEEAERHKVEHGLADGGAAALERVLAAGLGHLVEEVRSSLDYFAVTSPQHRVTAIVLTGGGAQLPGLAEHLSTAMGISVRLGDPVARLRRGQALPSGDALVEPSLAAVPVGLALGAAL